MVPRQDSRQDDPAEPVKRDPVKRDPVERDPVVRLEGLGVRYQLRREGGQTVRGALRAAFMGLPTEDFWALRGLDLELQPGRVLGVVGRNGAGKSTLCQVLAGVLRPDEGRALLRGEVRGLLGLGVGFHEDLTGRDNVQLAGAFLGLSADQVTALLPKIAAFAEVETFLDVPLKHWSSGMRARLGFALGLETRGDILVLDEVLAVGDEGFRERCLETLRAVMTEVRAMIFVSHDGDFVERIADEVLWLEGGRRQALGPPSEVLGAYRAALGAGR